MAWTFGEITTLNKHFNGDDTRPCHPLESFYYWLDIAAVFGLGLSCSLVLDMWAKHLADVIYPLPLSVLGIFLIVISSALFNLKLGLQLIDTLRGSGEDS